MQKSSLALTSAALVAAVLAVGANRLVAASESPSQAALDDATIVAIFDAANTADIETGNLAKTKGQSQEVRDFGAMLARDHTQVRQLGRDLAAKLGVTPTPPKDGKAAADHAATMKRLSALKPAEFDHEFLRYEVTFHKNVIDAVKTTLLPAIKNDELKDLVTKVAPAFQAHMMAADALDKKLAAGGK